jgi:hypothetical protein
MENEDAGRLRAVYSDMTDGKLLALAVDTSSLTETARYALADELRRRNLGQDAVAQYHHEAERLRAREGRQQRVRRLRRTRFWRKLIMWSPLVIPFVLVKGAIEVSRRFLGLSTRETIRLISPYFAVMMVVSLVAAWILVIRMLKNDYKRKRARREHAEQSSNQQS